MKVAIGVKAQDTKEAEDIVKEEFGNYLDFRIHSLEPATPEQTKQLRGEVAH